MRFFPVTEEDREAAVDAYSSFAWDPAVSFSVNWSEIESRVDDMGRLGVDAGRIPSRRQMFRRLTLTMLRVLPGMQPTFDYLARTGGPASGSGNISAKNWGKLRIALPARYERHLASLGTPSHLT